MNFLFFFSILATVLSVSLDKHHFNVASLLAETGGKEKILEMIEQLRNDNKETIEKFTNKHTDAISDDAAKKATFDDAVKAEEVALGLVENKKLEIVPLQADVDSKRIVEENAEHVLNMAQDKADAAAKFLAEEEERLDDEKDLLKDVHELLDKLSASASLLETALSDGPAGRKLLSIVDLSSLAEADPNAIAEVRAMIDDLISKGEEERVEAQQADKVAKSELAEAKKAHQKAWDILAMAIGRVDFATVELGELQVKATAATKDREVAQAAHEKAVDELKAATKQLAIETARVKKEEEIFVKVSDLLATIQ